MNYIIGGASNNMPGSTWVDCSECGTPAAYTDASLAQAAKLPESRFICQTCALKKPGALAGLFLAIAKGIPDDQRREMRLAGYSEEQINEMERAVQEKMGLR